jgi:hypothetical protein
VFSFEKEGFSLQFGFAGLGVINVLQPKLLNQSPHVLVVRVNELTAELRPGAVAHGIFYGKNPATGAATGLVNRGIEVVLFQVVQGVQASQSTAHDDDSGCHAANERGYHGLNRIEGETGGKGAHGERLSSVFQKFAPGNGCFLCLTDDLGSVGLESFSTKGEVERPANGGKKVGSDCFHKR